MKYLPILLLLAACNSNDVLHRVCPSECWPEDLPEDKRGVGVCVSGTPVCDETNSKVIECQYPDNQIPNYTRYQDDCDGLDNNCDGAVDDGYYPRTSRAWNRDDDNPCVSQHGVCGSAEIECRNGKFRCNYPDTYEPGSESSCDGWDNDCDARIDEDLGNEELCYDAEFWTATNGDCRPGVIRCIQGDWLCYGQKLPSPELCDQIDNDCNGIVDDTGDTLDKNYDIVFIIDTSGSMCSYISAVAAALDAYVEQFEGNEHFRFAIVIMSNPEVPRVILDTDFTDLETIRTRLLSLGCSGSGAEASLDSFHNVCDETNPLALSWRDEANRLFFGFTDEPLQTYSNPNTTDSMVVDACIQSSTLPFIWGRPGDTGVQNITSQANGLAFSIVNNWVQIFDDLNSIVITLCGS